MKNELEWPEVSGSKDEEFDPDNVKPGHTTEQREEGMSPIVCADLA